MSWGMSACHPPLPDCAQVPRLCSPALGWNAASRWPVVQHKWLGLLWRPDLYLSHAWKERLAAAEEVCSSLIGLVAAGRVPRPDALQAFEAKVEGTVASARWLWSTADGALEALTRANAKWSKALLGGVPWRNTGVAALELGWSLDGASRAVLDICRRRARLFALPASDFFRSGGRVLISAGLRARVVRAVTPLRSLPPLCFCFLACPIVTAIPEEGVPAWGVSWPAVLVRAQPRHSLRARHPGLAFVGGPNDLRGRLRGLSAAVVWKQLAAPPGCWKPTATSTRSATTRSGRPTEVGY